MSAIWKRLEEKEEGFTLIELLVVVIIIGILAAIAIPVFLNQRENAWESEISSDLRNASIMLENHFSDAGSYSGFDASTDTNLSPNVTDATDAGNLTDNSYCLEFAHGNLDNNWMLSSDNGSVQEGNCPASP